MQISDDILRRIRDYRRELGNPERDFDKGQHAAMGYAEQMVEQALDEAPLSLPVQPVAAASVQSGEAAAMTGEDQYRAWCEVKRAEFADDPADLPGILRMLDRWGPEALPADDNGQVHFARSLLDSAAEAIRKHLYTTPPTKGPEDDLPATPTAAMTYAAAVSGATPHGLAMQSLRERCKELYQAMDRDAMLRQSDPVETLFAFAKELIDENSYVIGWNDGWDECQYQIDHGKPSP